MNCEAYSSFEGVSSDHRIVTAKIRLNLRKNATRTATTKHYDWALLNNNRDIRDKYVLDLRNRFETLQEKTEKGTPNDEYENFVIAHLDAAAKCIPTKTRTKYRVPWETVAVREKRAHVKTSSKSYRKNPTHTNVKKLKMAQYQFWGRLYNNWAIVKEMWDVLNPTFHDMFMILKKREIVLRLEWSHRWRLRA